MSLNSEIKKVLVIGSGPIVIGQAAEFDYSGTQACETMKKEGKEVILINSNPATIMTDRTFADKIYIEPMNISTIEKIIAKERPDSIICGMGGQTALNLSIELHDKGILDKYNVKVIGTPVESIKRGEDRELFRQAMIKIGEPIIESEIVTNLEDGYRVAKRIGYPVVIRPAYTLGGVGGGIAYDEDELRHIIEKGLKLSRASQVLVEKSILGWKEIEFEVMRDNKGTCISICDMENIDPVGIHTGDSIVIAPTQTLNKADFDMLKTSALKIIDEIGIIGGCNVQFALHPTTSEYALIEINPRVSRSSALASKATGYPIARVSAKLALGYNLDEIKNELSGKGYANLEPQVDYIVVKIPKWPFDKFFRANRKLGTKMMATGEVMSISDSFESALLKGVRSLEIKKHSLIHTNSSKRTTEELLARIQKADDERLFDIAELLRRGIEVNEICKLTAIESFFINGIKNIVEQEEIIRNTNLADINKDMLSKWKLMGFSDTAIAILMNIDKMDIRKLRKEFNIYPKYHMIDTFIKEEAPNSNYYYSTYTGEDNVSVDNKRKIIVIGSGPIRIGQGIEFDYCTVHAIQTLKKLGIESIIVNNNPETVSTDFSVADKLYFEPLSFEDVLNVIEKENPEGVIIQFGGQTAIKLAKELDEAGIKIIGTSAASIDAAEDRELFDELLESLNIKRPRGRAVFSTKEGINVANEIKYPVLVRPSYVLGGQGMEICHNEEELVLYLDSAFDRDKHRPVLIDKYLNGVEVELDAICDGEDILIPGILEHIERAGIHSGDSITICPPKSLSAEIKAKLAEITKDISIKLQVKGMINIQFIVYDNEVYVIEVNPRSSRTVPYISKLSMMPIVELATKVSLGYKLKDLGFGTNLNENFKFIAAKFPVFSTEKIDGVEASLGPEMRSTGEVLGVGKTFDEALYKGFLEVSRGKYSDSKHKLITLVSIDDKAKEEFLPTAKKLINLGYKLIGTPGTYKFLVDKGIECENVNNLYNTHEFDVEKVVDSIVNREFGILINTPTKANDMKRDGFKLRRAAIEYGLKTFTSLDTLNNYLSANESNGNNQDFEIYNFGIEK